MKTWPELETHSHYMQMRLLVLRGFDAILRESNLGVGYQAASDCGKNLVFERFFEPGDAVKAKLLVLVEGEKLGPRVELTPERSVVIRALLQEVLTAEDWAKIAQAAAQQVRQQVMDWCVAYTITFCFALKAAILDRAHAFRGCLPAQYAALGLGGCGGLSGALGEKLPLGPKD